MTLSTTAKNVQVGQTTMASSIPVTLASDQTAIPITPTSTGDTPLPTSSSPRASIDYNTSVARNIKASAGLVTAVTANNQSATGAFAEGLYYCFVDKASAPANGDTILWSAWVPANSVVHVSFDAPNQLNFATGVSQTWSTTGGVVTNAGGITGSACVRYT